MHLRARDYIKGAFLYIILIYSSYLNHYLVRNYITKRAVLINLITLFLHKLHKKRHLKMNHHHL